MRTEHLRTPGKDAPIFAVFINLLFMAIGCPIGGALTSKPDEY